jgi:hypothetical protein
VLICACHSFKNNYVFKSHLDPIKIEIEAMEKKPTYWVSILLSAFNST